MKKEIKRIIGLFMICTLAFTVIGCGRVESKEIKKVEANGDQVLEAEMNLLEDTQIIDQQVEEEEPESEPIPEDSVATIISFGDTLCHTSVFDSAYDSKKKIYEFSPMFKYVKKHIKKADIAIGNCESSFAGSDRGYSGYPAFNAPEHLATDLSELGVDIVSNANNHCLDKGFSGLSSTLDYLDDAGIDHVGTARTKKEQKKILIKDVNGIKTAFLAYTYGTNGIPVPKGKEFCVNYINKDLILKQIKKAKKKGAEAIVVSMHWGIEYQTKENANQDELAEFLIKHGVNVVLGCHPHVLQPMKMVKVKNKNGKTKKGLVIFSQGNFFSGQKYPNTRNTALFKIKLRKDGVTGKVTVDKASYIPLYVYDTGKRSGCRYQILDLNKIIKEYKAGKGNWSKSIYNLAVTEKKRCKKIIGPKIDNTKK